jgi:hypothetical protein
LIQKTNKYSFEKDEIETTDLVENNAVIEPISNEEAVQSGIECK